MSGMQIGCENSKCSQKFAIRPEPTLIGVCETSSSSLPAEVWSRTCFTTVPPSPGFFDSRPRTDTKLLPKGIQLPFQNDLDSVHYSSGHLQRRPGLDLKGAEAEGMDCHLCSSAAQCLGLGRVQTCHKSVVTSNKESDVSSAHCRVMTPQGHRTRYGESATSASFPEVSIG